MHGVWSPVRSDWLLSLHTTLTKPRSRAAREGMKQRKKQYDSMTEANDMSPASEQAFQQGIPFPAKYIGTLDVPRPNSRVEIVAAMRRIRYEFKAKAIKKKKVTLTISTNGIRVTLRRKKKARKNWTFDENRLTIMNHAVYRIFYVSHDSQDLKIFSYIARDSTTNSFKCNVFKAYKKSQAMRVVRTVGQAFEVCHRLGVAAHQRRKQRQLASVSDVGDQEVYDGEAEQGSGELGRSELPVYQRGESEDYAPRPGGSGELNLTLQRPAEQPLQLPEPIDTSGLPLTHTHTVQLLRAQLEQQVQHTQVALAQVQLLRDQLQAEQTARVESQARTHQLLVHNRELLQHSSQLVQKLQQLELQTTGRQEEEQPAAPPLADEKPELPDFETVERSVKEGGLKVEGPRQYANAGLSVEDHDSPDSGHQEMSSESLSARRAADSLWRTHTQATTEEVTSQMQSVSLRGAEQTSSRDNLRMSMQQYDQSPTRPDDPSAPSDMHRIPPPPPVPSRGRAAPRHDLMTFEDFESLDT